MLYWICPECGRECSPAVRDCPACSVPAASKPSPSDSLPLTSESRQGLLALAEPVDPIQAAQPSSQSVTDGAMISRLIVDCLAAPTQRAITGLVEETLSVPLTASIDSLVRPLVESAEPEAGTGNQTVLDPRKAQIEARQAAIRAAEEEARRAAEEAARLAAEEEARRVAEEAARVAAEEQARRVAEEAARVAAEEEARRVADEAARLAAEEEARRVAEEAARVAAEEEARRAAEEAARLAAEEEARRVAEEAARLAAEEEARRVAEEAARLAAEEQARRAADEAARVAAEEEARRVAEEAARLAAEEEARRVAEEARRAAKEVARRAAEEAARRAAEAAKRRVVKEASLALALHAEPVLESVAASLEAEQVAIHAIAESFARVSDASLLAAPAEIVAAPAPADLSCIGTPRPTILPVPLSVEPLAAFLAVPRLPTLAGPALPPELRNLTEWRAGPEQRLGRRIGFPTWIGSVLAAMALFFVAGTLLQYFSGNRNATAAVTQGPQARGTSPANTSAAASAQDSLSRSVEVSGLRLVPGWNHKEQVQFLVVNHSANSLPAISIQITVRAPDSVSTTPPILNINAVIRGLGPYQSKEIRTDLDSTVSPTVFADWQSLRTDIQVTSAE